MTLAQRLKIMGEIEKGNTERLRKAGLLPKTDREDECNDKPA